MDIYTRRKAVDVATRYACLAAAAVAVIPLGSVLTYLAGKGLGALHWSLFTALPKPVGELGGGFANAIVGTLVVVGLACAIAVPIGVLAGVYLSDFGKGRLPSVVRFCADVMSGVPSIVIGIFVYGLVVLQMRRFSAIAGGTALAILMLPTITRTTEELLRLVPDHLREAGLALGMPRWKVILRIVLPAARSGIVTGIMLAVARAAGETAPLLFTALGSRFWSTRLDEPIATLPTQIFTYAISPYEDWQQQAWAAALVLVAIVMVVNLVARTLSRVRGVA